MIFYFTATGNSKFIADKIADQSGENILCIADCMKNEKYRFTIENSETLGFVVPVYYYGLPIIVVDFLQRLNISASNDYYTYAILNCGGTTGNAGVQFKKTYDLDAVFGLKTVDNYVPMFKSVSAAEVNERLDKAETEIDSIIRHITNREKGSFNRVEGTMSGLLTAVAYPMYKRGRKTRKFTANNSCTTCGLCEIICPRGVIKVEDGKPLWQAAQCEECLGCLHRCPTSAINYGKKSEKNGRYINPRVTF